MNDTDKARELVRDQLDGEDKLTPLQRKLGKKAGIFKRVFLTADGEEVIKALEAEFEHSSLFSPDPQKTAYNLGGRDLLVYIKQLIKYEVPQ